MIARLLRWIAVRKRESYRRWLRRNVPNIPPKDTGYRMIDAARMGGNCPSAWRGKDGK